MPRSLLLCNCPAFFLGLLCAATVASFSRPSVAAEPSANADAWTHLWENRLQEAAATFELRHRSEPKDLDTLRGLILSHLALGHERLAFEALEPLSKIDGVSTQDFLLCQWVYSRVPTHREDEVVYRKTLQRIRKKCDPGPLDRRVFEAILADLARKNGLVDFAEKGTEKLHRIRMWSIAGPFDNTSGSGHAESHFPGPELDTDPPLQGKNGRTFRWYSPPLLSLLDEIDFENQLDESGYLTCYAGTEFEVDEPRTYILSLSHAGALRILLDGTVLGDFPRTGSRVEAMHYVVDLGPGRHTLLLKVSGEGRGALVAAALSRIDGSKAKELEFAPLVPGRLVETEVRSELSPLPMVASARGRFLADPSDPETRYYWLLARIAFDLGPDPLEAVLPEPESSLVRHLQALLRGGRGDRNGWHNRMARCLEDSPQFGPAVIWRASDRLDKQLFAEADSILDAALIRARDFVTADFLLLDSYRQQGLSGDLIRMAEGLRNQYPEYSRPYFALAEHYRDLDPKESRGFRSKALQREPRSTRLASEWFDATEKEDWGALRDRLGELARLFPDSPYIQTQLGRARLVRDETDAYILTKQTASQFPYAFPPQYFQAAMAEAQSAWMPGARQDAIKYYGRALNLRPGDFEIRDKIRKLQGKRSLTEVFPAADLESLRASAPRPGDFPAQPACVLVDERRRVVFEDGSRHGEQILVAKILTDDGVDLFDTIDTGINPFFSNLNVRAARALREDGTEAVADQLFGKLAFPSLANGDLIEVHYTWSAFGAGRLGREFWDSHVFQWSVPCLESRFVLATPADRDYRWEMHNHGFDPGMLKQDNWEDFNVRTWTLKDIPPRVAEIHSVPTRDVVPWLDVSSVAEWAAIADWYAALSDRPSSGSPEVRRTVEEILEAVPGGRDEKIEALHDYVSNEIGYEDLTFQYSAFVPEPAANVLYARYGDCKDQAGLLRAMLAEAGIDSYFALVSPVTFGRQPYLPSPRFNHAIVAVETEGGYRFLDPTVPGLPVVRPPESLQGAAALVVRDGADGLVPIPLSEPEGPELEIRTEVDLASDTDLRVDRHETFLGGSSVAALREAYAETTDERRRTGLTETLGRTHVGFEIDEITWSGLDGQQGPVGVDYSLVIRKGVGTTGSLRIARVPWRTRAGEDLSTIVASPVRREGLDLLGLRVFETEILRFRIPDDLALMELPAEHAIESDFGRFEVSYEMEGNTLVGRRTLMIHGTQIEPESYGQFRGFVEEVIREPEVVAIMSAK